MEPAGKARRPLHSASCSTARGPTRPHWLRPRGGHWVPSGTRDASPPGPGGLAKVCNAGLTSILVLHSPHTPQQAGLTKDLSCYHKLEPKAHTPPIPPRVRMCAHTPTPTHAHMHTRTHRGEQQLQHSVHDCTGRCPTGLPSQPAKHKCIFF